MNNKKTINFIIKDLKFIIDEIGHFPTRIELAIIDKSKFNEFKMLSDINRNGGINYFRELIGYPRVRQPWDEERAIIELKVIINKIGHFPTMNELTVNYSLRSYINTHKGINYFRKKLGYGTTENNKSELSSYISNRGSNSEKIVKELIIKWCVFHNLSQPELNVKLAKSKMIEFVCEINKRIGIDVTNTKTKSGVTIQNKWKHKEYHLHLDELWIIVFSDIYTDHDYIKFNKKSPENVKVMSIETFMEELQISIDENLQLKINKYNTCTFHNKDELSNPKQGLSKYFKFKPDIRVKD